jgi:hypothetical protein
MLDHVNASVTPAPAGALAALNYRMDPDADCRNQPASDVFYVVADRRRPMLEEW